jgi:hypothetical protein
MKKQFIIEESDGKFSVSILKEGYNIIEETIYDSELAKAILAAIEEARR